MAQQLRIARFSKRFSLSIYISLLLALTAIVPVLATIGSLQIFLRPSLIQHVNSEMTENAQTQVQLIDAYLAERLNDIKTLSQSVLIKNALKNGDQQSKDLVLPVLFTAQHRDIANYISLSLLDPRGGIILSYPAPPQPHGQYLIQPGILQLIEESGKVLFSDVFYDRVSNTASVDLYSRVIDDNYRILGIVRISLGLHRVWEPIDRELQVDKHGSYAFILDQNGIYIAYSNPDRSGFTLPSHLFKAVAPLSSTLQQRIKEEDLYGNSKRSVITMVDQKLVDTQYSPNTSPLFQMIPAGQSQTFQAVRYSSTVVPWIFFFLKPMNVVTDIADQQLLSTFLIIVLVLILAVAIGVTTGRSIARPILHSVASLRDNSQSLKTLADEESVVATEQSWMVEASQVALASIKYYTNAVSVASQRIQSIGVEIGQSPSLLDEHKVNRTLQEMAAIATYIERAVKHQEAMNEKLGISLRVTTQAAEQLTKGAKSTDDAAAQLEHVVEQLISVVGSETKSVQR
jgi:hypothetical protein